ncbi:MAG: hypothetical protein IKG95_00220 [Bacteroidales bacterium]|nr:hypothetical protein [Bacteroidales bacterium]
MRRALLIGFVLLFSLLGKAQEGKWGELSPLLKSELPEEVKETSGLFFHNGRLWTHNDSGGKPILYALDTTTFEVVQKITLDKVKNKDWEDVCTDGENVFVGDFGNNKGNRKDLRIYMFPLADIPQGGDAVLTVDSITFRFADQTDFSKRKVHDFDCESFFASDKNLYLFSKGWETGTTRLYRLPKTPGDYVAEVVNGFDSQGLLTGADYDRENHVLVLVGYVKTIWKPFMYLIFDFDENGERLSNCRFEMPHLAGAQTEGVCFFDNGRCYLTAETSPTVTSRVFVVDFRKWIDKELIDRKK